MNISGYMPVKLFGDTGAMRRAANDIAALGKKCLVVTGGGSAVKSGALADLLRVFSEQQIEYRIFDRVEQNPRTRTCHQAGEAARAFGADFLAGVGGGSPLDAVKAIGFYAANPDFAPDDIYTRRQTGHAPLPSVLIGTTAGTGSEVTGVAVLTNENGRKQSISGADCYGTLAVLDPTYTHSVPYGVTVSTALDAFAHALESAIAENSNLLSETYALRALPLVWEGLLSFYQTGKLPEAALRETLYYGSIFAGLAINITGTLFPHTVGYVLTEQRGIAHGRACAAFTPVLLAHAESFAPEKWNRVQHALGVDRKEIQTVTVSLAGVNEVFTSEEADRIAGRWQDAKIANFARTPGGFTAEDARQALLSLGKIG